ncbi:MAG: GNAT family N-acetyltransferase [Lachnospiraceae bacterium]|nr:GNAT family N-acetyltransferase [Lachnospiraceae bacterium]
MIRKINSNDREEYITLAKEFYRAGVTLEVIDTKNIELTFDEMMRSDEYAECYFIEDKGNTVGFALLAKTFSQEAGGMVIWLEELYIRPQYRSMGYGTEFFEYLEANMDSRVKRVRLEVEEENTRVVDLYKRMGFKMFAYDQMVKEYR